MKKGLSLVLLAVFTVVATLAGNARAEGVEVGLDITLAERYIWRGIPLNEEYVLQPSLTVGASGFYVNGWANVDMTDWGDYKAVGYGDETNQPTEIDYSAGYETTVGDMLIVGFGFVNYTFPHQREIGFVATTEIYGTLGFDVPLSPTFTAYVDEDQAEGAGYISMDIGHSFNLFESGDMSVGFDFGGHLGWANHKFVKTYYGLNEESRFHDWSLSGALPITVMEGVSITPAYVYTSVMTDELRDFWDAAPADLDKEVGIFTVTLSLSGEV